MSECTLDWDQFEEKFKPIKNHLAAGDVANNGCMFETSGPEFEYIKERDESHPGTVWTFMDDGEGGTFIGDGLHYVNRIGYIVTEVPAQESVNYTVDHDPGIFEFAIALEDANGTRGIIEGQVDAGGVSTDPIRWDVQDAESYVSAHTMSAAILVDGELIVEISGDVWRALENSDVLDTFIKTAVTVPSAEADYWVRAAIAAGEKALEVDCESITSDAIRLEYLDSGREQSDVNDAVERLTMECPGLFEGADDDAFAFLMTEPPPADRPKVRP